MAAKKHTKTGMKRSNKKFYKTIASMGGTTTKKRHGKDYYAKIALLSHAKRRANRAAAAKSTPAN